MNPESNDPLLSSEDKPIRTKEKIRLEIVTKLQELGIENCPEEIIEKLILIEQYSEFNHDSEMICEAFGNVFSSLEKKFLSLSPSLKQKKDGMLAAFLHDIGKTGPSGVSLQCQLSIIKLFSIRDLDVSKYPNVGSVLEKYFPESVNEMTQWLKEVGVGEETTMRAFWNNHAWWTHDVLGKYPDNISDRVDLIASSHHVPDGENPCDVLEGEIPRESIMIGTLEHYVDYLEERVLTVIDKYQAALMRPKDGSTHDNAITYLRNYFEKQKDDGITAVIIETIDELGKTNSLFPNTKNKYKKE